ncbi:MAG: TlpA disulfide reductase family protein, partial [Pseudomonadota bacterium]
SDVTGTFLTETGDYRYLNGQVKGETFEFGTFDGAHAFLFRATLDNNNALQGEFWSGSYPEETWSATRDADVALRDGGALTYLNKGFERLEFSFPDESGTMVSLQDERFTDKVVIVTLVGSWCPNCHDETALLAELYTRYSGEGFEVIALMFEHLEDEDAAWTQINAFRTKFDLQYPTLLAGISEKTQAASKLPALNHILSFPTAIFIDRRGAVRHIHTGFTGPGTGVHYEALRQDTIERIESLLAEPATPTVSRSN